MNGTSSLIRRLGPFERLFFDMSKHRSTHFVMTFELGGTVTEDAWRSALRSVQTRHPLLSSIIKTGQDGTPEFHRVHDAPIPVRVVDGPNTQWTAEVEAELAGPFDTGQPPLARTVMIRDDARTSIMIVALHAIADGRSIQAMFRDALTSVAGGTLQPYETVPSREELIERLGGESKPSPSSPSGSAPNRYAAPGAAPRVASRYLGSAMTADLRARARREGTSLHGALCAAVTLAGRASSETWRSGAVRIDSPIDIRPQLGAGDECVPLLTPGKSVCDADRYPAFWDLARSARTQTVAGASTDAIRASAAGLAQLYAGRPDVATVADLTSGAFGCDAIVTNLGAWPYPTRFGELNVTTVLGPALLRGLGAGETLGGAPWEGGSALTHASFTPIPSLLDSMEDVLRRCCAS